MEWKCNVLELGNAFLWPPNILFFLWLNYYSCKHTSPWGWSWFTPVPNTTEVLWLSWDRQRSAFLGRNPGQWKTRLSIPEITWEFRVFCLDMLISQGLESWIANTFLNIPLEVFITSQRPSRSSPLPLLLLELWIVSVSLCVEKSILWVYFWPLSFLPISPLCRNGVGITTVLWLPLWPFSATLFLSSSCWHECITRCGPC